MIHGEGMAFTINGRTFDPERTDAIVKLGTVEEWEIVNGGGMMMAFDHPFHIHTNAFQVLNQNAKSPPFQAWKDTVNVPMGESVRVRIPFQDFPGRTVYHCHILDHEDLGMMDRLFSAGWSCLFPLTPKYSESVFRVVRRAHGRLAPTVRRNFEEAPAHGLDW
jgi:FtsP/CotA-like multicopper oxidase with cupredoxin domain